jgi:ATP-dependent RNA helicase RhlE
LTENPQGLSLVFSRTKHGAEKLMKHLEHVGFSVASIHGNKSQGQRERALKAFREGQIRVLVATDVAARGIDVPGVTHVYNYDLPEVADAYVHRIGRTARAGRDGIAIAFCAPDEIRLLRDIERLMNIDIAVASGEVPADRARPKGGRGGNGARNAGRPAGNGHNERRPRPQGGSDNVHRAERSAPSPFAGDDLLASGEPKKQHRKGQGPAAQAAHEQALAKRPGGNRNGRPGQKQGEWRNRNHGGGNGGNGGQNREAGAAPGAQGQRRRTNANAPRREEA